MTGAEQRAVGSRFWRQQFDANGTLLQAVFDGVFGILIPVAFLAWECLTSRGLLGGPFFLDSMAEDLLQVHREAGEDLGTTLRPGFYALLATQMAMLAVCLVLRRRAAGWSGWFAGWFAVGSVASLGFCGAMALFAASALATPIAWLRGADTPSFTFAVWLLISLPTTRLYVATLCATHFAYLRNTVRAFKRAKVMARPLLWASTAAGLLIAAALPAVVQWSVPPTAESAVQEIIVGDRATAEAAVHRLKWVHWCCRKYDDRICAEWWKLSKARKERSERATILADAYQKLTGHHPGAEWARYD